MTLRGIAIMAVVGLLALPALADAGELPALTATEIRIGNHAGYVRVVIEFDGKVAARQVTAGTLTKMRTTVRFDRPGVSTQTSGKSAYGIRAALQPANQGLNITLSFAPYHFKYLYYAAVTGNVLAMDLWKSAPPAGSIATCPGLTLRRISPGAGVLVARGTEHGIFENQFQVVVRGANGRVLGRKTGVHGPGAWTARVRYSAAHQQTGTLEAVAFSAKDGSIDCLAQTRMTLPAS
jgi:hypothetical protein